MEDFIKFMTTESNKEFVNAQRRCLLALITTGVALVASFVWCFYVI